MPSTTIFPSCTGSRALMHRRSVDFPDPERPITATISLFSTVIEIPLSTSRGPKRLTTFSSLTSDMDPPLENLAHLAQAEADDEVDAGRDQIDLRRREGRGRHDLARPCQLDETDERCE